jgi:tryptophan-rich hypothetical protein
MSGQHKNSRLGTKWTRATPLDGQKHFEVVDFNAIRVALRCIVTASVRTVSQDELNDTAAWQRGWL